MARTKKISRNIILNGGYDFVIDYGFDKITARGVMKHIGRSTMPLYDEFTTLDNYKIALLNYIIDHVTKSITSTKKDKCISATSLLTESICQFSSDEPDAFIRFFLKDARCKSLIKEYMYEYFKEIDTQGKSKDDEIIFDEFWYYTLGKASAIAFS